MDARIPVTGRFVLDDGSRPHWFDGRMTASRAALIEVGEYRDLGPIKLGLDDTGEIMRARGGNLVPLDVPVPLPGQPFHWQVTIRGEKIDRITASVVITEDMTEIDLPTALRDSIPVEDLPEWLVLREVVEQARDEAAQAARDAVAARDGMVVDGTVTGDDLILSTVDGTLLNAGNVRGPAGTPSTIPGPPGSPTEWELRGTGFPNGVVAAPPGTYYTDTAGTNGAWRWLKTKGTGNAGWTVLFGDTGWRLLDTEVTLFPGASAAYVAFRRQSATIELFFQVESTGVLDSWLSLGSAFQGMGLRLGLYPANALLYDQSAFVPVAFANGVLRPTEAHSAGTYFAFTTLAASPNAYPLTPIGVPFDGFGD